MLGLPLIANPDNAEYAAMNETHGVRHFGVWSLADAAESCFGTRTWPMTVPTPQATVEFELASIDALHSGVIELRGAGHEMLHDARTEAWGQTVARLLAPDGLLVGLSYAPWFHKGN